MASELEVGKVKIAATDGAGGLVHENASGIQVGTDSNTTIGFIGTLSNHPLKLIANNDGKVTIDSTGNVSIGTAGTHTLHVQKDVDDYIAKFENDGNATTSNGVWIDTRWNTATNSLFKVTTNSGAQEVLNIDGSGLASFLNGVTVSGGITTLGGFLELTVASNQITITSSVHQVDIDHSLSTDNLHTINGGSTGSILILRTITGGRHVNLIDNTGNLRLNGDCELGDSTDTITLVKVSSVWQEVSRSLNN